MYITHCAEIKNKLSENGFLYFDEIAGINELRIVENFIEEIFKRQTNQVNQFTKILSGAGNTRTIEMNNLVSLQPDLLKTYLYQRILAISRQLCGPHAEYIHDHAIYKEIGANKPTPWHQDAAISLGRYLYAEKIHWWIPFQETTPEAGALQFVRGSHRGKIYPHYLNHLTTDVNEEIGRKINALDVQKITYHLGSASAHLPRTLHYAGPNSSEVTRKAWVLQFGVRRFSFARKPIDKFKKLFGQFGLLRR